MLVAMAIEDALQERGLTVAVASTLEGANNLIATRVPAVALLDIHLPDGESLDLASRLHDAGCAIAISSAFEADAVPDDFNFAAQFRKPVSPEVLAEWVSAVIS